MGFFPGASTAGDTGLTLVWGTKILHAAVQPQKVKKKTQILNCGLLHMVTYIN